MIHICRPEGVAYLTAIGAVADKIPPTTRCHCGGIATIHHAIKTWGDWYPTCWYATYTCPRGKNKRSVYSMMKVVSCHIKTVEFSTEARV